VGAQAYGIVDRDYANDESATQRRAGGIHVLPLHEIEGVLFHPGVLRHFAAHLGKPFDRDDYVRELRERAQDALEPTALERWKHGFVASLREAAGACGSEEEVAAVSRGLENPRELLARERAKLHEALAPSSGADELLKLFPSKHFKQVAFKLVDGGGPALRRLLPVLLADPEVRESLQKYIAWPFERDASAE
jgi:hypothetical protein